jgi:hypothetical protein
LKYFVTRKWKKTSNSGTADVFLNIKFRKKKFLLFHYVCISIDTEFHGKSIDEYYLRVLLLS